MASPEPAGRALAPGRYEFDALQVGDQWTTDGLLITDGHLLAFAGLTGDFFAPHMDDVAARELGFPGRIAHGLLILGLVDGLKNRAKVQLAAIASLGWTWEFRRPVHPGDRITARIEVAGLRPTRRPERGIVRLGFTVLNQHGETIQDGENRLMVHRG
ncbi:MAG: MaoC/PaaZ C-terminal domain-containing protein [Geminicoccaceae bacterium]